MNKRARQHCMEEPHLLFAAYRKQPRELTR
jgi:hypothetical protein